MEISLLADHKMEAPKIAEWYFGEWGASSETPTLVSVTEKILLGTNRVKVPILFVAHVDGVLVGAGELKQRSLEVYPDYEFWLDGIFIPLEYRGNGYSKKLINFASKKAMELGISSLYLRCTPNNVGLYEKHGYSVLAPEGNKFIMGLHLST